MRLITHVRPHLDDICAMWLLRRYLPEAKDAELGFISTGSNQPKVEEKEGEILVGVGRGRFDEHKGDMGETATTLVWTHVRNTVMPAPAEVAAVTRVVEWVRQIDLGLMKDIPYGDFTVPAIIEGCFQANGKDSHAVSEFGFRMLDAIVEVQRGIVQIEADWERRTEFPTRYGRGVAFQADTRHADSFAYQRGFTVVVIFGKEGNYLTIRAPADAGVDLTEPFNTLTAQDPDANWYLHHAKAMIISGGERAPGERATTLPLSKIVEALQ